MSLLRTLEATTFGGAVAWSISWFRGADTGVEAVIMSGLWFALFLAQPVAAAIRARGQTT